MTLNEVLKVIDVEKDDTMVSRPSDTKAMYHVEDAPQEWGDLEVVNISTAYTHSTGSSYVVSLDITVE